MKFSLSRADLRRMRRLIVITVLAAATLGPVQVGVARPPDLNPVPAAARAVATAPVQNLGFEVGRIEIPAIGLDEVIREGVSLEVIDRGVAHWAGTPFAGSAGNVVLAGHRTIKSRPFYYLDRLENGDEIYLTGVDGRSVTYRVRHTMVVDPIDTWIANGTTYPTLTLFACHPRGSAAQRIVVRAALVGDPVVGLF